MNRTLLVLSALLALTAIISVPARGEEPRNLLTFRGPSGLSAAGQVKAEQRVDLDLAALDAGDRLTLPDGGVYDLVKTGLERRGPRDTTWRGKLYQNGTEVGQITLTSVNGRTAATILAPGGPFQIEPLADGGHRVTQLDLSAVPGCRGSVSPGVQGSGLPRLRPLRAKTGNAASSSANAPAAAGPVVEVLVLYSPAVLRASGNLDNVRAIVQQSIDMANTAYQNSQIDVRVHLAGLHDFAFDESAFGNLAEPELVSLQESGTAAALRASAGADIVSLFVEKMDDACGIGYIMDKQALGPEFAPYAYNVIRRSCFLLTLAHEMGHNMGCEHDPDHAGESPNDASFPYAYGHFVGGSFHTVMSYTDTCGQGCTTIANFSNPDVSYQGTPTGIAGERDNHKAINNTAALVATFDAPVLTPGEPCRENATTLCLVNNRFKITLNWQNQFNNTSGSGQAIPRSDLSGFFSFGDPSNVEVIVKVLDFGNVVKVFYGELTNLKFNLNITDTATGRFKTYGNTAGDCGQIDQAAFAGSQGSGSAQALQPAVAEPEASLASFAAAAASGSCQPSAGTLCLLNGRFAVTVDWANPGNNTRGQGGAVPLSDFTGAFFFTEASNLELLAKIIDFGNRVAVFYGTLSDLDYTLRVADTLGGKVKTYHNPNGSFCGGLDNTAF